MPITPVSTIHSLPRTLQHSSISAKRACQLYKIQHFYVNFTFPFDLAHNFFIKINKKNVFARKRDDRLSLIQKDLNKPLWISPKSFSLLSPAKSLRFLFFFERPFPAMNILILVFLFWKAVPGHEHINFTFLFWMAVSGREHDNFTFSVLNDSSGREQISFTSNSAFISLLFLFSFHNKNVLFCFEN